jgi:hypothetical protein
MNHALSTIKRERGRGILNSLSLFHRVINGRGVEVGGLVVKVVVGDLEVYVYANMPRYLRQGYAVRWSAEKSAFFSRANTSYTTKFTTTYPHTTYQKPHISTQQHRNVLITLLPLFPPSSGASH